MASVAVPGGVPLRLVHDDRSGLSDQRATNGHAGEQVAPGVKKTTPHPVKAKCVLCPGRSGAPERGPRGEQEEQEALAGGGA